MAGCADLRSGAALPPAADRAFRDHLSSGRGSARPAAGPDRGRDLARARAAARADAAAPHPDRPRRSDRAIQRLRHAGAVQHCCPLRGDAVGLELGVRRLAASRVHARVHAHHPSGSIGGLGARRARHLRTDALRVSESVSPAVAGRRARDLRGERDHQRRTAARGGLPRDRRRGRAATSSRAAGSRQRRTDRLAGRARRLRLWGRLSSVPRRSIRRRHARDTRRGDGAPRAVPGVARVQTRVRRVAGRSVARVSRRSYVGRDAFTAGGSLYHAADSPGLLGPRSAVRPVYVRRLSTGHRLLRGQSWRLSGNLSRPPRRRHAGAGHDAISGIDDGDRARPDLLRSGRAAPERRALQRSLRLLARRRTRASADVERAAARSGSVAGR